MPDDCLLTTDYSVRVLSFHGKLDRAAEIVNESGDLGAAYHMAKQYEAKGDIKQAREE